MEPTQKKIWKSRISGGLVFLGMASILGWLATSVLIDAARPSAPSAVPEGPSPEKIAQAEAALQKREMEAKAQAAENSQAQIDASKAAEESAAKVEADKKTAA